MATGQWFPGAGNPLRRISNNALSDYKQATGPANDHGYPYDFLAGVLNFPQKGDLVKRKISIFVFYIQQGADRL